MATMHYSSHIADDVLLHRCKTLELRYNSFICFGNSKSLMVERNSVLL